MEKRYWLPITSLLSSTRNIHQKIVFQTWLPPEAISYEACVLQIVVREGILLSYKIKEKGGRSLFIDQGHLMEKLKIAGIVEWYRAPPTREEETEEQSLPPWQLPSPSEATHQYGVVPRRLNAELPPSHAYRQVLLLIDGRRNVEQIAKTLGKDPEEIVRLLQDLHTHGFMIW